MKTTTLHMIGNAHLDPVWLWQWQEGFAEAKATFRSALDRLDEYPDFIFTSSSAAMYEWIEGNEPAMFEEIKARVAEGRWQIVGGWWIQPDCNLPGGESFVRQGLYGQRYFKEKLGVLATVGYNVDSFGHHGMLPQILRKSGMDAYVFMRPAPNEKGLPGPLFWWESDDGSRVLTYRIPYEYCTNNEGLERHIGRCATELKAPFTELMCFYGVGNHGGGPTRQNIEMIRRLDQDPRCPRLPFSHPARFFDAVREADLPISVVHEDLQHHASGCYAVHSGVKRWNRRAENLLVLAEKWSAIAHWLTGQPYPADLEHAWKLVLFNQFHDILAGTSIEEAYEDARNEYGEALAIAGRALNHATQSIGWQIKIEPEEGMKPIVVFNPHAWASKTNVELEFGRLPDGAVLRDDQDQKVPWQAVQSSAAARGRNRLCFVADLPPLGYRVYRMQMPPVLAGPDVTPSTPGTPPLPPEQEEVEAPVVAGPVLENDWFRLEFDRETGYLRSLVLKASGAEMFRNVAAKPVVIEDRSDTWSHDVFAFHDIVDAFKATSVTLVEQGPVKSVVRVRSTYGRSQLVQDWTVYRDLPQIDVQTTVDWHEHHKLLKLQFPLNLNFIKATYEIPYGHIQRPVNGEEEPGQSWVDVSGTARGSEELCGLSLLNDGKYSFDVHNKTLSMTVLRSPIYAHHDPFVPANEDDYVFIDQGVQRFTYSLLPHMGSWETAGTVQRAAELNQRPVSLIETYHEHGTLPQADAFLQVDHDNVVVSAVKRAEDDDSLIVRAYETTGARTDATIRLPGWQRVIEATFGPCEIKTFRVPRDPALPVAETNLLEWTE